MAQTLTFTIKFNVDPPNVQQALDAVNSSLKNVGVSITNVGETAPKVNALDDSFAKLGLRLQGMQNLLNVISGSIGSFIRESNEEEAATARLAKALENQGIFTTSLLHDLQQYANMRQDVTGIDNTATLAIMAQLSAMGFQGEELKRLTDLSQDLSVVMETDLKTAARLVGRAIQDGGEELKRYGFSLDKVAGQAEDFGQTGKGAMKRNEQAIGDLQKAFGKLLFNALQPFVELGTRLVKMLTDMPPAAQAAAFGVGVLTASWTLFNSQLGITQIILGATVGILLTVYTAFKSGEGYLYAFAGVLGIVATAFTMVHGQMLLSTLAAGQFRFALQLARVAAAEFLTSLGPLGWVIIGLGAVAAAWGLIQRETKNAEDAAREYQERIKQLSTTKLNIDIGDATVTIAELESKISTLKKGLREGAIQTSPELAGLELQLQFQRDKLKLLEAERDRRASMKRIAADEIATVTTLEKRINEITEILKQRTGTEADVAPLKKELAAKQAELDALEKRLGLKKAEAEKVQSEKDLGATQAEKRLIDSRKDLALIQIDIDETVATSRAASEEEKLRVTRDFALKRLEVERAAADAELVIERDRIQRQLDNNKKLTPTERVNLTTQLTTINEQRSNLATTTQKKVELIETKYRIDLSELPKLGSIARAEQDLTDLERKLSRETDKTKRDALKSEVAAKRDAVRLMKMSAQELNDEEKRLAEERRQLWLQEHQGAKIVLDAMTAGIQEFWNRAILVHRQAADVFDGVWLAIENSVLSALGNILTGAISNALLSALITTTSMSAIAAAAAPAATLTSIATFGGAAFTGEAAVLQALANVKAVSVATAFEQGGQFEPGQRGFVEGTQYELVAPRRTFEEIIRTEIVPMVVRTTLQSPRPQAAGGYDFGRLERKIDGLRTELRRKQWSPLIENRISGKRIVEDSLTSAEIARNRKRR